MHELAVIVVVLHRTPAHTIVSDTQAKVFRSMIGPPWDQSVVNDGMALLTVDVGELAQEPGLAVPSAAATSQSSTGPLASLTLIFFTVVLPGQAPAPPLDDAVRAGAVHRWPRGSSPAGSCLAELLQHTALVG